MSQAVTTRLLGAVGSLFSRSQTIRAVTIEAAPQLAYWPWLKPGSAAGSSWNPTMAERSATCLSSCSSRPRPSGVAGMYRPGANAIASPTVKASAPSCSASARGGVAVDTDFGEVVAKVVLGGRLRRHVERLALAPLESGRRLRSHARHRRTQERRGP